MTACTDKKLRKQFLNQILLYYVNSIFIFCCLSLLVPNIVWGSMNPQKSCGDDDYYKPYVTVYKKIRGMQLKTLEKGGLMDTTQYCDKFICINGPVMIYENAVDTHGGRLLNYPGGEDGDAFTVRKRQINGTCVPGLNGIPPGFDCNSMGTGSGVHTDTANNDTGVASETPKPDPVGPIDPDSTPADPDDDGNDGIVETGNGQGAEISAEESQAHGLSTTDSGSFAEDEASSNSNTTPESNLESGTYDYDYAFQSTDRSGHLPSRSHEPIWKPCIFKKAVLEVYDHKCFKLNQIPKKTKMNSRMNDRIITTGPPNKPDGNGFGRCDLDNVMGRKIYAIKMLTKEDDYRLAALTQFEFPRFEIHSKDNCGTHNMTENSPGHSFAVIGNTDHFDYCYTKKNKNEDVFIRLHMQSIPMTPTICLYEPGDNDRFDDYFGNKKAKDFKWSKCPSKYHQGMTTPSSAFINYGLFAMNNPSKGQASRGRSRTLNRSSSAHQARQRTTEIPVPGRNRIPGTNNKKQWHTGQAVLSSNCTNLPVLDKVRCAGKSRTGDVCQFMERSLQLIDPDDNGNTSLSMRRNLLKVVDDIFEKICVNVSAHLPGVASRLVMFYLEKFITEGGILPTMKNDTWRFLNLDLQTCLMQAEPIQFRVDENAGDTDNDYDDNDDDDPIQRVTISSLSRKMSMDSMELDDKDDALTARRRRLPDIDSTSSTTTSASTNGGPIAAPGRVQALENLLLDYGNEFRLRRDDPLTPAPDPTVNPNGPSGNASGRAGGSANTASTFRPKPRPLPRPIKEVEGDGNGLNNIPYMPSNVEVIHQLTIAEAGRFRRDVTTESGIKLFYYEEASELEFEFNVALDAHWKIFATVLGYCNKFYSARKAETFPRLYNSYFEDILEPIVNTWISSADNEALELVVSELADPITEEWLNSCLEASFIVSDSITFRPPRPLTFMEGTEMVTNYFEEVPKPEFFIPQTMKRAIVHGYHFEANAVDAETGNLANGKLIGIPSDPGCHWVCSKDHSDDDCHKVCGANEKPEGTEKPTHILHGPDGETSIVETEFESEEGYGNGTSDESKEEDEALIKTVLNLNDTDDKDIPNEVFPEEDTVDYVPIDYEVPTDDFLTDDAPTDDANAPEEVQENSVADVPADDENVPAEAVPVVDSITTSDDDLESRVSRKIGRTMTKVSPLARHFNITSGRNTRTKKISNAEKLARSMGGGEYSDKEESQDANSDKPKPFWKQGAKRKGEGNKTRNASGRSMSKNKMGAGRSFWNAGRSNNFHEPQLQKITERSKTMGRNLKAVNQKHSKNADINPIGRHLKGLDEKQTKISETGRNLIVVNLTKIEPSLTGRNLKVVNFTKIGEPSLAGRNFNVVNLTKIAESSKKGRNLKAVNAKQTKPAEPSKTGRNLKAVNEKQTKPAEPSKAGRNLKPVNDKQTKTTEASIIMGRNLKDVIAKQTKTTEASTSMGRNLKDVNEKQTKAPEQNKAMGRKVQLLDKSDEEMAKAFEKYYNWKHAHAGRSAQPKDKVNPPPLGRNVPTFDESRLKILLTTQSPEKLVGATTTAVTSTTTTIAPRMATTYQPSQRKAGTGRRIVEKTNHIPRGRHLGRHIGNGRKSSEVKGRTNLIHHFSNKSSEAP